MNLATIQHLYTHDGPFVNLHIDVSRESEDAIRGLESGWTTIGHRLADDGIDRALLDQIGERVLESTGLPGGVRRSMVATGSQVVFDDIRMGRGAWPEVTDTGPLPDVSGWLAQVDGELPFVLVTADREGAEIDVYRSLSQRDHDHDSVQGQTLHINKVPAGEWAELQHHTEEVWRRNARMVAEAVRGAGKEHGTRMVLLAGEVRARAEIREALESGGNPDVVEIESGGRAAGSSTESLWSEVDTAVGQRWEQERQQVLDRLDEQSGQGRAVARGLHGVLTALVRGQVARIVVDLGSAHEQTVDPSDFPGLVLPASAFGGERLRADQVLVAAGAATDADLSVLPAAGIGGDGVAALLRWDEAAS